MAGFPHSRRYTIIEDERIRPFLWLQSLDEPEVAFVIIESGLVDSRYSPALPEGELSCLQLAPGSKPALYCIVTVPPDPTQAWANLRAPLALNPYSLRGRQVILLDDSLPLRFPLYARPSLPSRLPAGKVDAELTCAS